MSEAMRTCPKRSCWPTSLSARPAVGGTCIASAVTSGRCRVLFLSSSILAFLSLLFCEEWNKYVYFFSVRAVEKRIATKNSCFLTANQ